MTSNDIDKILSRALYGKSQATRANAQKKLIELNNKAVQLANSRLRSLEKTKYKNRYAYQAATAYTQTISGKNRFTTSRKLLEGYSDIAFNLKQANKFISYESSTITGAKNVDIKILDSFRSRGVEIPKTKENEFLDFIASDEWQTLKKEHVDSSVALTDMSILTADYGVSIEDVIKAFKKVVNSSTTYDIALEELGYTI